MAIKKLRLSFDLPIQDLLALVATRNDALHIDVIGDGKPDRVPKALRNGAAVAGLLEGPGRGKSAPGKMKARDEYGPISTYQAVAIFLMKAADHKSHVSDMKSGLAPLGVNGISISPQLAIMRKDGSIKQVEAGIYKLTPSGVHRFEKMIREREQAAKGAQA